jgi:hypothetical protein
MFLLKKYEVDNEHPGENGTNGVEMKTKLHVVSGQAGGGSFKIEMPIAHRAEPKRCL